MLPCLHVNDGDRVRYQACGGEIREATCCNSGTNKGMLIRNLSDGHWCFATDVVQNLTTGETSPSLSMEERVNLNIQKVAEALRNKIRKTN